MQVVYSAGQPLVGGGAVGASVGALVGASVGAAVGAEQVCAWASAVRALFWRAGIEGTMQESAPFNTHRM